MWHDLGDAVVSAGAIAAALTAIGALVYVVVHFSVVRVEARISDMIKDATEPLTRNGGHNVGDLPRRFDDMVRRVERIERRQMLIYDEIMDGDDKS